MHPRPGDLEAGVGQALTELIAPLTRGVVPVEDRPGLNSDGISKFGNGLSAALRSTKTCSQPRRP